VREVVLVHAIDLGRGPSPADDDAFARQVETLEAAGVRVRVDTPLGYAPHAIASMAAEHAADLIVMGTRGQGLFHTGFSGSVSSDVVRLSPIPVLLAPAMTDAKSGGIMCARLLTSVLVPTDLSSSAERVCDLACSLAASGMQRMEIMHVVELSFEAAREGREPRARDMLEMLAARAHARRVDEVVTTIARGMPDEMVARAAASGRYSLVVLAPRCHDTIDQEFDSVTSAVIRESSTPVLLAPPGCDPAF
jgi:nucleotide-binding universal stress UspA family protein